MLCVAIASAAYVPALTRPAAIARGSICRMQEDDLRTFLLQKADVSEKFVDNVVALCDGEMIGSPTQLKLAADAGILESLGFKTVVRIGIEKALGASSVDVSPAAAGAKSLLGATVKVPRPTTARPSRVACTGHVGTVPCDSCDMVGTRARASEPGPSRPS